LHPGRCPSRMKCVDICLGLSPPFICPFYNGLTLCSYPSLLFLAWGCWFMLSLSAA
jgi:hypothetical protein